MIVPIVEGHAERDSIPVFIRRVLGDQAIYNMPVRAGFRVHRDKVVKEGELERAVETAIREPNARALILLLDADDDCPKNLAPGLLARGSNNSAGHPFATVIANVELEAWFIAGIESLRGQRGIRHDAVRPDDPETIKDAKGWLTRHMINGHTYVEVLDQPALIATFDYTAAAARSRSLRKFLADVTRLGRGLM
ncbi:MAG: DUF4276 family protein [bacterium]